jgi:glycosyltransferase involved in cell wall biosynthesis
MHHSALFKHKLERLLINELVMKVSVLIPTFNRPVALAATLTALMAQSFSDFDVVVSDQSDEFVGNHGTIQTITRLMELHHTPVKILSNFPRQGIAHQRQFLLDQSQGKYSLFIDDDVLLEKDALEIMVKAIEKEECAFTGMGLIGLSFKDDVRPAEQSIEWWEGRVEPEIVRPGTKEWQRYKLHNAANLLHVREMHHNEDYLKYKVAWIGGCILYDTEKLREVGGFSFWQQLPEEHCGEDVLVQLRLMEKFGGCGLLPSKAYHQELPTTIHNREVNAPECLLA